MSNKPAEPKEFFVKYNHTDFWVGSSIGRTTRVTVCLANPARTSESDIHVIEMSAFTELQKERDELRVQLEEANLKVLEDIPAKWGAIKKVEAERDKLAAELQAAQDEIEQWKTRDADRMADLNAATSELQAAKDDKRMLLKALDKCKREVDWHRAATGDSIEKDEQIDKLTKQNQILTTALESVREANQKIADKDAFIMWRVVGREMARYAAQIARQALAEAEALEGVSR